jgi:hypothetical protein
MHWPPLPIVVVLLFAITALVLPMRLEKPGKAEPLTWIETLVPMVMQVVISVTLLGASLYIILSGKYTSPDQHWAYSALGSIVGFWFKDIAGRRRR